MHDEEERTVIDARQARTESAIEALLIVLGNDLVGLGLPLDSEWRIRQQIIELLAGEPVLGEAVTELDVVSVLAL